ncbi:hypothetical protein AQ490_22000 [Wenjunlia vitaminophila]|uniref:DUF1396 domain-containing protein n=1 Tax=Wenjunlia vitaminophila TaxID=76728 RepID=A0A0T6LSV6_WENVI|nr:hypothetical protein [Wenjunlia vitaminophila]KRV48993.1 hypothetical protein AQ490_22000 [Wenjunlia vitaminophila]
MKPHARASVTGVLLAAALFGAASCSDSSSESESKPRDSATRSSAPRPAAVAPAAAIKKAAQHNEQITSLTFRMSGEVPGTGTLEGQSSMAMDPPAMQMKMKVDDGTTEGSGEVEIRLVDGAMYMSGGEEAASETGAQWLKFDMAAMEEAGGQNPLDELGGQTNENPAEESNFMTEADDVKEVGAERVDGVKTTHYTGTITMDALRKSLDGQDAEVRERRESKLEEYEKLGVDVLTMDMWIDESGHTKQFRTRADAKEGPMDVTITFLEMNKPVVVEAPPAAETLDMSEMMGGAGQS